MRKNLLKEIEQLDKKYSELKDSLDIEKANRDLATLYNLKNNFDETFDVFFDRVDIRKKYNDWDYQENCIKFEKVANDLLKEFDEKDLQDYIEFFNNYIAELEDELNELRGE